MNTNTSHQMHQPRAINQPTHPRPVTRSSLIAIGVAAVLGSVSESATASLLYTGVWASDVATYNAFAANCTNAGGTGCPGTGQTSPSPNGTILFSWGTVGLDQNSRTTWTNNTGSAFTLDQIVITADGTGIGTGLQDRPQGTGAAPAWEWNGTARFTQMVQSQVQITVGSNAAVEQGLFSGFTSGQTWYPSTGVTVQTPIDYLFDASEVDGFGNTILADRTVAAGGTIAFRLFETVWNSTQNLPDLVFAPMTIQIYGTPTGNPAPIPATLALCALGLALLRARRGISPDET